jgi:hypothetical protein
MSSLAQISQILAGVEMMIGFANNMPECDAKTQQLQMLEGQKQALVEQISQMKTLGNAPTVEEITENLKQTEVAGKGSKKGRWGKLQDDQPAFRGPGAPPPKIANKAPGEFSFAGMPAGKAKAKAAGLQQPKPVGAQLPSKPWEKKPTAQECIDVGLHVLLAEQAIAAKEEVMAMAAGSGGSRASGLHGPLDLDPVPCGVVKGGGKGKEDSKKNKKPIREGYSGGGECRLHPALRREVVDLHRLQVVVHGAGGEGGKWHVQVVQGGGAGQAARRVGGRQWQVRRLR